VAAITVKADRQAWGNRRGMAGTISPDKPHRPFASELAPRRVLKTGFECLKNRTETGQTLLQKKIKRV
jgi:hypothetical protein